LLTGVMLFLPLIFLDMADQTVYVATWVINSLSSSLLYIKYSIKYTLIL
jgi:hypothetical protein